MNVDIDIKKIRKQIATCNRRLKRKVKEEIVKITITLTNDEKLVRTLELDKWKKKNRRRKYKRRNSSRII